MKIVLDSLGANAFINLVRTMMLCRLESVRPIAFSVGTTSDVCNISDNVEEDMSEFISNVSSSCYAIDSGTDLVKLELSVDGTLSFAQESSQLAAQGLKVLNLGVSEVLHSLCSVPVTIYFRKAAGHFTIDENEEFLEARGVDVSTLVVTNSRHSPVSRFGFKQEDVAGGKTVFEISLQTDGSMTEDDAVKTVLSMIADDAKTTLASSFQ